MCICVCMRVCFGPLHYLKMDVGVFTSLALSGLAKVSYRIIIRLTNNKYWCRSKDVIMTSTMHLRMDSEVIEAHGSDGAGRQRKLRSKVKAFEEARLMQDSRGIQGKMLRLRR